MLAELVLAGVIVVDSLFSVLLEVLPSGRAHVPAAHVALGNPTRQFEIPVVLLGYLPRPIVQVSSSLLHGLTRDTGIGYRNSNPVLFRLEGLLDLLHPVICSLLVFDTFCVVPDDAVVLFGVKLGEDFGRDYGRKFIERVRFVGIVGDVLPEEAP